MKQAILFFLLVFLPILASADKVEIDGICYKLIPEGNEAEVVEKIDGYNGNIIIPAKVIHEGVEYSVKSIGVQAFWKCTGLLSVFIPNSVTSIEWNSFYGCSGLTSITIPNSVISIGYNAFKDCSSLTTIDIPNSVTSIGYRAFDGTAWYSKQPDGVVYVGNFVYRYKGEMPENTSISIKEGTIGFADYAFSDVYYASSGGSRLASITIPSSVTSIAPHAFEGCSGLTSIDIPNSVTSIGGGAFMYCSGLTSVIIPNSVISIGEGTFYGCSGLTSITIPNSMTSIEHGAFWGCHGLTSVTIPNSVTNISYGAFHDCSSLTSVTIPTSVTTIGERAFMNCCELTTIDIPNSVTYIGFCAFEGTAWLNNQQDGLVYAGKVVYRYKGEMPDNTNISIENGTLGIAEYAFSGAFEYVSSGGSRLTSITIPNSVTSIGTGAFSGCSSLTSIDIPNSVTSIGYSAFSYCSGLTSINIPNSLTSIEVNLFDACSSLTSITIPKSLTYIEPGAFNGCSSLTSIEVENNNPKYDSRNNCNAIIETSSNTLIVGCKNTTFPSSVTSIGVSAFRGCSGLTSVSIPNNVTSIGLYAFEGCSSLTTIDLPNSVTFIGGSAFSNCSSLSSVTIPNSVTSIVGSAFGNCRALSDFYCWANNVPSTSIHAFEMTPCNKATLHVPIGSVDTYKNTSPWNGFGNIVALTDDDPKPTGIESLKEEIPIYPVGTYYIDGKRLQKAQRGLNIIRMNDGKTIKRIVK